MISSRITDINPENICGFLALINRNYLARGGFLKLISFAAGTKSRTKMYEDARRCAKMHENERTLALVSSISHEDNK